MTDPAPGPANRVLVVADRENITFLLDTALRFHRAGAFPAVPADLRPEPAAPRSGTAGPRIP